MRMWMITPKCMCRKHLLGEHGEIHKHRHNFEKKHSINGRIFPIVQIEPRSMKHRHDVLAKEMLARGYNHKSPYEQPDISYLPHNIQYAFVNGCQSIEELRRRCPDCRNKIRELNINLMLKWCPSRLIHSIRFE